MKAKNKRGEGTVYQNPKNKSWRVYFTEPQGKRVSKRFRPEQEKEAREWLLLKRAEVAKLEYINSSDETLGGYCGKYLQTYSRESVRARTYERYLSLIMHVAPIAPLPIQEVRPEHIMNLYQSLVSGKTGQPLSGSTKVKLHRLLKQIFKQAILDGLVPKNPLEGVPTPKVAKVEIETFEPHELKAIFVAAENSPYKAAFMLLSVTGLRLSELLGLRHKDVDYTTGTIHINKTLHLSNEHGLIFEDPKSSTSKRKISVPRDILNLVQDSPKSHPESLFANTQGDILRHDVLIAEWRKTLKLANVKYRGMHTLRHTHATTLIRAGVPIPEISRRLGHARISTTLDIYSHAMPADDSAVLNAISTHYNFGAITGATDSKNAPENAKSVKLKQAANH